jgi:hypothetical protein
MPAPTLCVEFRLPQTYQYGNSSFPNFLVPKLCLGISSFPNSVWECLPRRSASNFGSPQAYQYGNGKTGITLIHNGCRRAIWVFSLLITSGASVASGSTGSRSSKIQIVTHKSHLPTKCLWKIVITWDTYIKS